MFALRVSWITAFGIGDIFKAKIWNIPFCFSVKTVCRFPNVFISHIWKPLKFDSLYIYISLSLELSGRMKWKWKWEWKWNLLLYSNNWERNSNVCFEGMGSGKKWGSSQKGSSQFTWEMENHHTGGKTLIPSLPSGHNSVNIPTT